MVSMLYAAIIASPLWWLLIFCSLGWQLFMTRNKPPSWKLRLWQAVLAFVAFIAGLNLVHRAYAPAEKYIGVLFFLGIGTTLLVWVMRTTQRLTRPKPNPTSSTLLLGWGISSLAIIIVSGLCLFAGVSLLFFYP